MEIFSSDTQLCKGRKRKLPLWVSIPLTITWFFIDKVSRILSWWWPIIGASQEWNIFERTKQWVAFFSNEDFISRYNYIKDFVSRWYNLALWNQSLPSAAIWQWVDAAKHEIHELWILWEAIKNIFSNFPDSAIDTIIVMVLVFWFYRMLSWVWEIIRRRDRVWFWDYLRIYSWRKIHWK